MKRWKRHMCVADILETAEQELLTLVESLERERSYIDQLAVDLREHVPFEYEYLYRDLSDALHGMRTLILAVRRQQGKET